MTEFELKQLQSGDKAAFKRLYDDYSGALYGMAIKVVGSEEAAQDVLQESFVKIWKNLKHYDDSKGSLFTWMARIVRNTGIDLLRRKDVKHEIQMQEDYVFKQEESVDGHAHLDATDVRNQVAQLKPEHREVLNAVYFLGHTHEEAAEKLNIPLGTVKSRIRLAVRDLKRIFGANQP